MKQATSYIQKAVRWGLPAAFLLMSGCGKSFLDTPPQGKQPGEEFWKNAGDAAKAVNAMYANLHEWRQVGFAAVAVESLGSDDTEKGSSPGDASYLTKFDDFTVGATDGQVMDFWKGQYQQINFCNQVLDNVPQISMDENLKNRYLAEAKFIRAYAYFRLVRAYGDVPLRLRVPKDASEYNLPRTDKAEVWAAIEKDLTEAAAVLPPAYGPADLGRATKGAALSLHAKVAMYQKKWANVLGYTNEVTTLGYSLFPNYEQLFRIRNENAPESVFEIQCQFIPGNKDASNSQYSQIQGVRASVGGGWGFNVPTEQLVKAYEPNDPRRDATIIFRGETTPDGDIIPPLGDNPMYNQKSYVPFRLYVTGYNEGADQNVRVIRYAEVLLMQAEAANELGNATLALKSLNAVRARARGGNPAILPDVTTTDQAQLRLAIWQERRVELAMESDRYFDVIRQGRAATLFGPSGFVAGKNELWPVPQNEIDISAGTLTQNKGY
ncbi:RagB/SusD family nutrient uptake outer membrane protein [Chitinophaga nivalis]|uniref:RagB/SusD family nutrient uptake outer membrane protein n=1 Tax=Chitinophaga nivalis TaxID=2991709 RepID=A0ABT3INT1_9BACT|nr:RagB/SusD family nutrient uptake outer membrane protein [Chitinophaga nivalis]MCW3464869.1 RagB/SusD family nutrient uptake outer membrane protein [Chitinophaga nivalis]MCW3485440.1 RagB/SusD family nutrient uptake outer membrane protein [Chitinophaga nivalis]